MTDWRAIVEQFGPIVWKTAYRILGNESDAADCFQETFMSALGVAEKGQVNHWPALLRKLATARAIDRLRQRGVDRARSVQRIDCSSITDDAIDPQQSAETAELAEKLRDSLRHLPPREAAVFCLRLIDELSYDEIADELGLTTNSVGVLLHKARKRLRNLWERSETDCASSKGGQP